MNPRVKKIVDEHLIVFKHRLSPNAYVATRKAVRRVAGSAAETRAAMAAFIKRSNVVRG